MGNKTSFSQHIHYIV